MHVNYFGVKLFSLLKADFLNKHTEATHRLIQIASLESVKTLK
jgi:hypothetical protein